MPRVIEYRPTHCTNCGSRWGPNTVLVGWANQREKPCRSWTCRTCDHRVYRGDLPAVADITD